MLAQIGQCLLASRVAGAVATAEAARQLDAVVGASERRHQQARHAAIA
jgi:hypothetical protein